MGFRKYGSAKNDCVGGYDREAKKNRLRWPNTVCARFTDSVSDAIKRALGLW